ncbi:MAG: MFS transporter [Helicobacteraceae bacterium 4484_230]|nr:MAG: MFS transporter [Helicobacteraceae bacterium 4484_230]
MPSYLIAAFYFFYFAIIAVYVIFMPKVLSMVGYTPSEIGIIFAAAPLVRFAVPFAFIKGLQLNRTVFNQALVLMSLSALAFFAALNSFWGLLIANIGIGIGLSLILPYIEVIALMVIGKERYGKVRLFGSIGFIAVALVLVKALSTPNVAIGFLLAMTVLTSVFGYAIASLEGKRTKQEEEAPDISFNPLLHWSLWLGLILMQVSFGAFYNFFTIYETDRGLSMDTTIYLWSFGVIAEILLFYFQGPLLKHNLQKLLQFAVAGTILRWMLLYLYPDDLMLLYFSQSLHALSFALFHTAAISYLFTLYKERKLAQQFFFGLSYGLGGFIGAVSSGYIYEIWPNELFLSAAAVAFLAFLALLHAGRSEAARNQKLITN